MNNIFSLNEIAEKLNELSDYDKNWLEAYLDASGEDLLTALEQFEDNSYFYKDMTLEDVAEELVSEGCFGYIPDSIAIYIDYAAIARDLECDSYFETKQGVIYLC
jgi:antirestriction protein